MADYLREYFPQALHILDFFHAFEHLAEFAVVAWPKQSERDALLKRWKEELRAGQVKSILAEVQEYTQQARPKLAEAATGLVT